MFDTITWHTNHVLTSVDIQQRYLEICRRAKKKIVIPEDIRLVEIQDVASGVTGASLPLFSGQEIETKTGKTVYGSPKLDTGKQTATDIGKETVITAGISSGVIIPQSSAEIPETPRNSAEKRHKEKESKENSPSIPRTIPPARDDEDKVSLSPDGNRGNVSAESCGKRPEHGEEYSLKLQRLGETCYNLGCSKGDVRKVLMIENIAMDDSPIWQLIEELKASGGRYSFTGEVLPALWGLVKTGRLRMMEEHTDEVKEGVHNVRQMLSGIGVPSYDMDELCGEAKGKEDVLQEVIREIRRSKGRILSVSCFIRSRLKKRRKTNCKNGVSHTVMSEDKNKTPLYYPRKMRTGWCVAHEVTAAGVTIERYGIHCQTYAEAYRRAEVMNQQQQAQALQPANSDSKRGGERS